MRIMSGAESVMKITNKEKGVLLLHGFTGNPFEMRYLGDRLLNADFSINIPRYAGHGTSIYDMVKTNRKQWIQSAREAYLELSYHCRKVYVAGLSMGGLITGLLSPEFDFEKIVIMSVPSCVKNKFYLTAPVLGKFKKIINLPEGNNGIFEPEASANHINYGGQIPINQVWELSRLINEFHKASSLIKSEVLIIQSAMDEVITHDSADRIFKEIGSTSKTKLILEKSNHVITRDYEKDIVADAVIKFFNESF